MGPRPTRTVTDTCPSETRGADPAPPSAGGPPIGRWGRLLVILLSLGLLVALPTAWVTTQYKGEEINSALSYPANDGWCHLGYTAPGFGIHCFGDYAQALISAQVDLDLPGAPPAGVIPGVTNPDYTSLYPPVSQYPHVLSALAANSDIGRERTFYGYMSLLALAVFAPALWVAWMWRRSAFAVVPLILIGVAAVPVFATLDRGNSAGFVIPFLLAFAIFLGRDPRPAAPIAAVGAALVRPQFILIAVGLLAVRQWKQAIAAVASFAVITVASFALMPAGFTASFRSWYDTVSGLTSAGVASVTRDIPANPSIPRSVTAAASWVGGAPSALGEAGWWVAGQVVSRPLLPVVLILIVTALLFIFAPGSVPRSVAVVLSLSIAALSPAVAPVYYLGFALVVGALILRDSGGGTRGLLDEGDTWPHRIWAVAVVVAVTLSLVPLTFRGLAPEGWPVPRQAWVLENVGRLWFLLVVGALAWLLARAVGAARARRA